MPAKFQSNWIITCRVINKTLVCHWVVGYFKRNGQGCCSTESYPKNMKNTLKNWEYLKLLGKKKSWKSIQQKWSYDGVSFSGGVSYDGGWL